MNLSTFRQLVLSLCFVLVFKSSCVLGQQECAPADCIVSQWTEWSVCSQSCGISGVRTRDRQVLQPESCGGACGKTDETETCNRKCCPKNCVYTPWSKWGSCNCYASRCDEAGKRRVCFRFRDLEEIASCGGYCENNDFEPDCREPCCYKDCILGAWGPWGKCEAQCESPGISTRKRELIQEPDCGGKRCKGGEEQRACTGDCCPVDCVLGAWSEWTDCPAVCGEAEITRTRAVQLPECNGKECNETNTVDTKTCSQYINTDCKMGSWSPWSECTLDNGKCGQGSKTRTRKVVIPHKCRGEACGNTTETAVCFGECCRIDCDVGQWSEYGHCSTECGKGFSTRTRDVLAEPDCGGTDCPVLSESQDCDVKDTVDCKFTEWSPWSACSTQCGTGKQMRSRTLLTPAYCGGQCESEVTDEEQACESFEARRDCKVSAWALWTEGCIRDCDNGRQYKNRTIEETPQCGGKKCPELTSFRSCHQKCTQLCNQGECSCRVGYVLQKDGYSCEKVDCGDVPNLTRCPPGTQPGVSCSTVKTACNGTEHEDICQGSCRGALVLKGSQTFAVCRVDGSWSSPNYFCGPDNQAPLNISVDTLSVSELVEMDECFAKMTTSAVPTESWDKHIYSVVDDPSGTLEAQGDELCIKRELDYETSQHRVWTATIRSTDLDGLYVERDFTFTLLNNNDPPRSAVLKPHTIPENSLKGLEVGCLITKDDDEGQNLTVVMLNNKDKFEMYKKDDGTYCVRVAAENDPECETIGGEFCKLNFEDHSVESFAVLVVDDGDPPYSSYFDIRIQLTNVEEPVTGIEISTDFIQENLPAGRPLLTLTAEDEDEESEHTFEILEDPSGLFEVRDDKIVAKELLDYESNPGVDYTLKMRATETNSKLSSIDKTISFHITDANERPFNLTISSTNAMESFDVNQPKAKENIANVTVGTLSVSDPDMKDLIQFSADDDRFIVKNTHCSHPKGTYCSAQLINTEGFDYETEPIVTIVVTARDKYQVTTTLEIDIEVLDMNDPPTDILVDGDNTTIIEVPENAKDFEIVTLSTEDQDADSDPDLYLFGPAASMFVIKDNVLKTADTSKIDFETYKPTQLIVRAEDQGLQIEKTYDITVKDVNEAPVSVHFSTLELAENSPEDSVVATMTAVDPDTDQTFRYKLLDDARGRLHVKNNQLLVKESTQLCGNIICSLNYEKEKEIKFQVKVIDDGNPPLSTTVSQVLTLQDRNDPPTGLKISSNQIRENKAAGSSVGVLLASDEDGDDLTFTLLDHTEEFQIIGDNQLVSNVVFKYADQREYGVSIQVSDGKDTYDDTLTITVLDVNDAPQFIGSSVFSVTEGVDIHSTVAELSILDPDKDDPADIRLNNFGKVFFLTGKSSAAQDKGTLTTIKITPEILLDYEEKQSYTVDLAITDSKGLAIIHQITINVDDINDMPEDILVDGNPASKLSVQEGQVTTIGTLSVVDQDAGQSHVLTVKEQPGDHFAIDGQDLKLAKALDYEQNSSFIIVLEAKDTHESPLSFDKTFRINVVNTNEPPSTLRLSSNKVSENSVDGTDVGQLLVDDPDTTEGFDFILVGEARGMFTIVGDKLVVVAPEQCSSEDTSSCTLNFEQQESYSFSVVVNDNGVPPQTAQFDVEVTVEDVNDQPTNIGLSGNEVEELAGDGTQIGDITVTDEDNGQTHTFSLKDVTDDMFVLDTSGKKLVKASDDRLDVSKLYSLVIVATDDGEPSKSVEQKFFITVLGVSEAPKNVILTASDDVTQMDGATIGIPENTEPQSVVGVISAEDNDLDQTISFSLLDNPDSMFDIGSAPDCNTEGGKIKCTVDLLLSKAVNFELNDKYPVTVLASDSENVKVSKRFTIHVTDVPEKPTDIVFNKEDISVAENSQGTMLGRFTCVDEDKQDSHTFSLEDAGNGNFVISESGSLTVSPDAGLNFEASTSVTITVKATDSSDNSFTKSFDISIVDVNEPPAALTLSNTQISEDASPGSAVGMLEVVDPDNEEEGDESQQTFEFSLLNDAGGRFTLDGARIYVQDVDFESQQSHEIEVEVKDSGSPRMTSSFRLTIGVTDANDPPVLEDIDTTQLKEDMKVGDEVVKLSATDQDSGQIVTFSITEDEHELFRVEGSRLLLDKPLDFEDCPSVSVTIKALDNGNPPKQAERKYDFDVLDVNEAPSMMTIESVVSDSAEVFSPDSPVVGENAAPETVIAQLVLIDPDNDEDVDILVTGDNVAANPPGCLTLTKGTRCVASLFLRRSLDFEDQKEFTIKISAVDKNGNTLEKDFVFQVKDQNDPPENILVNRKNTDNVQVAENLANQAIAILETVDPDIEDTFTYEVADTSQFYVIGNKLWIASATQLDYEDKPEISLRVKVTDSGVPPLSLEKQITIEVVDMNEEPDGVSLTRDQVAENSPAGTEIGTFYTSDPDNNLEITQTFTYELIQDVGGLFVIEGGELKVKTEGLDYETESSHLIYVRVTDSGSPPKHTDVEFTISVTDSNDPPTNLELSDFTVSEDAALGTEIGTLSVEDFDQGQTVSFSIDDSDVFTVDNDLLVVDGDLDFETSPELKVEVTATDNGVPPMKVSKTFTISLTDANDAPAKIQFVPAATSNELEVDEGQGVNHVVGTVRVMDADSVDQIRLDLSPNSSPLFKLADGEPKCVYEKVPDMADSFYTVCSLDVLLTDTVKYSPTKQSLSLEIKAVDKGDESASDKWDIRIVDKNDAPTDITISGDSGDVFEVPENSVNWKFGALECVDPDKEQNHIFQIITHWDLFKVWKGVLMTSSRLDAEKESEYRVEVRCADDGNPVGEFIKTFTVKVKDLNEKPKGITLSHLEVPMTAKDGDTIALIEINDPDNNGADTNKQTHTCTIINDDSGSFAISEDSKELLVDGSVPVKLESVEVEIECTDTGSPAYSIDKVFRLLIVESADVPKAIVFHSDGPVQENARNVQAGYFSVVNQLTETDIKGEFEYVLIGLSETEIEYVAIEGDKLMVKEPVNFEKYSKLSGAVMARGNDLKENDIDLEGEFEFDIVDVNERPTEIRVYGGGRVPENSPQGTVIGNLNTVDPEPYQTYTYQLVSVAVGLNVTESDPAMFDAFAVEDATLKVGPGVDALDFESNPAFSLLVRTTDSGSPPLDLEFTVIVLVEDANDAPTGVSLEPNTVSEDAEVKQTVGRIMVEDADDEQDHHCIVNNLRDVPFTVENGLTLVVSKGGLDFESQRAYVVEVTCDDDGADGSHLKITASLTVTVLNVDEPPANISLSKVEIEEGNEFGALVGVLEASDPDSKQTIFSIEEGEDSKHFMIKGDNSLAANSVFDYETKSSYSIAIVAKDETNLSSKQTFSIEILDKNEKPTSITLTNKEVDENTDRGSLVGLLRTDDPDKNQDFVYSLAEKSGASGHFVIAGDRLEVGETILDHEESSSHLISITSEDNGSPPLSKTMDFTIEVLNKNEAPTEIVVEEPVTVNENSDQQTKVAEITVMDEETDQNHACKILNTPAPFAIQTTDLGDIQLVVSGLIDFEERRTYNLSVSCSDGEFSIEKVVNVEVKNLNEPPTSITLQGPQALPATITSRYEVGTLVAEDEDIGQTHVFSTSGPNSDILKVEGDNLLVLLQPISKDILDKPNPQINVTVTALDSHVQSMSLVQKLTFPITGIDLEALKLPEITLDNREIDEEAEAGDIIGEIFERNESIADHVVFSIKEDELDMFEIKGRNLVLALNISLSTPNSVDITIQALNKQTQETKERTVTFMISRSDKCWKDGEVCHDDARCVKVNETYHECRCKDDFQGSGYSCEQIDDCFGSIEEKCGLHGDCMDDVNEFVCKCNDGYTGKQCEQPPPSANPCYEHRCQNGGACKVNEGGANYTCVCTPGWTGFVCTDSIDECKDVEEPCLANGTCVDNHLSYTCTCPGGRYGGKCQFLTGSCEDDSCSSGGFCIPKYDVKDNACITQDANNTFTVQVDCLSGDSQQTCIDKFMYYVGRKTTFLSQEEVSGSGSNTRKKRSADLSKHRYRRDGDLSLTSLTTAGIHIYATDIRDGPDVHLLVTFVITNDKYEPMTRKQIVFYLEEVCKSRQDTNTVENMYCDSVSMAVSAYKNEQNVTSQETGSRGCRLVPSLGGTWMTIIWIGVIFLVLHTNV